MFGLLSGANRKAVNRVEGSPSYGVFFDAQTPEALEGAIKTFEAHEDDFNSETCRRNAERFGRERFQQEFRAIVEELWSRFRRGEPLE